MEIRNLGEADGLSVVQWETVAAGLEAEFSPARDSAEGNRHTSWLTTINADGSPHITSVGALWIDGAFWFQTGQQTRKCRNVARDPRCAMSVAMAAGDVVVEGDAQLVTDRPTLTKLAAAWAAHGWPAEVHESGTGITAPFNAPGQGPAPWNVYRMTPRSATIVATSEPGGSTRFIF